MCQVVNFTGIFLPPATKLGQGNIFRSVCQEFCSQGEGVSRLTPGGMLGGSGRGDPGSHLAGCWGSGWGVSRPTPKGDVGGSGWGSVQAHSWECPGPGRGIESQHALRQTPSPADGYCCRQYASYWNAFLLFNSFRVGHDFLGSFTPLRIHHLCTTCI